MDSTESRQQLNLVHRFMQEEEPLCRMDVQLTPIYREQLFGSAPPAQDNSCLKEEEEYGESLTQQLSNYGFNLSNPNLLCVQMINAIQAQVQVLEVVIFKLNKHPLFEEGIGFDVSMNPLEDSSFNNHEILPHQRSRKYRTNHSQSGDIILHKILNERWLSLDNTEKQGYLSLRRRTDEYRKIINDTLTSKKGKEHICLLCGSQFLSGRQLGGHMSRKHPGNSVEYNKKRQLHSTKAVQRERRKYFKQIGQYQ